MKNTKDLRARLLSNMDDVANGEMTVDVAKGVCNLAQQVYNTLNIELKRAKLSEQIGEDNIKPVSFDD